MSVAAAVHGGYDYLPSKFHRISHKTICQITPPPPPPPPIFISTNPNDVNPNHLKDLYSLCNHSSHRFPKLNSQGVVELIDINKLKKALLHSYVIVSVFTRPDVASGRVSGSGLTGIGGDWIGKVVPVTPGNGELVGFGRAVSDTGLTAAIYDVKRKLGLEFDRDDNAPNFYTDYARRVIPSLRRRGIGRKIVQRILRPFFRACGFGDDVLASTTMMYARSASTYSEGDNDGVKLADHNSLGNKYGPASACQQPQVDNL
ncbi:hypothetical protein RND71_028661 [Anisodus tanguticus]|uniref:Glucosamine-phosphate N-acetyltransferase n=1 Tax=Anisodus tanguticus TaxID=243964 RepID=A0AAE1RK25_9SOLA|nr:hypothetical protein RND71_028661 [Anisodus tanguticus]